MCGIFGYLRHNSQITPQQLYEAFEKIRPRGPDRSTFHEISEYDQEIYLGFQRLAIMDPTTDGDQPFTLEHKIYDDNKELIEHRSIYVICNGEIYNHHELIEKYGYEYNLRGRSDCEFLPYLYVDRGIHDFCDELRAEAAFAILDIDRIKGKIYIHLGRDAGNVRPLFIGKDENGFGFCSELKGLTTILQDGSIRQLRGGRYFTIEIDTASGNIEYEESTYFDLNDYKLEETDLDNEYTYEVLDMLAEMYPGHTDEERLVELEKVLTNIRETFEKCVVSVLESDVPIGALLSGGLDSSLVVSIAAKHLRKTGQRLRTFSIGIPGATDEPYARMVAAEAGTDHTHIEFSNDDFLDAIPHVIKAIESYDITTVRASTGQWLASKWVRENTPVKVLKLGDFSDEEFSGYIYNIAAKTPIICHNDTVFRVRDIGYFDALRSDRGVASNGLEARTPFAYRDMIETIMNTDPRLKVPLRDNGLEGSIAGHRRMEKWLLRKAFDVEYEDFDGTMRPYLPKEIIVRQKESFSNGCSSKEKSWHIIIQERVEELYTQNDIDRWVDILENFDTECSPWTKEAVHYLEIFTEYFGANYQVIPYYWMPSFCEGITDPSARALTELYDQNVTE